MLKVYNTLSHSIEEFVPYDPLKVTMYICGPTVYDHMHIGNLRTFIFSDILFRTLRFNHFRVLAVQNITDIDDKIIKKALHNNTTIADVSKEYTELFLQDIRKLNIDPKNLKAQPKATDYIDKIIEYVKVLIDKGFAYTGQDGSVYFDISKFTNYGKLSRLDKRELKTGTRTLSDEYTKDDVQDFSLWKSVDEKEFGYESPWGKGRPGWHIECSVMSQTILGNKLDIHTGGVDLIFPHHENEIAQSESFTNESPFVRYWVHGAHILVDGKKMSKSLNNFYTLSNLEDKKIHPLSLRYLYLQTHYRQEMNFTWDSVVAAQNALEKLWKEVAAYEGSTSPIKEFEEKFVNSLNEDLNMPKALSIVWEVIKSNYSNEEKHATLLKFDQVLGLSLKEADLLIKVYQKEIPLEVKKMFEEREELRKEKKFDEADKLREKIIELGFSVEDK